MAGKVIDRDLGFKALQDAIADLAGEENSVLVGVQGDAGSEMVVIAASNEFGTDRIPERSYLRSTVDGGRGEIATDLRTVVERAVDGSDIDRELGKVGEKWVGKIKKTIRDLSTPPNAPATIRRKGSSNPLIDQGRLRASITWRLHKGSTDLLGVA